MRCIREIALEQGFNLPTNADTQKMALYNWFGTPKTKYIVRVDTNSWVFGDTRHGERYKAVNGKVIEQDLGIMR